MNPRSHRRGRILLATLIWMSPMGCGSSGRAPVSGSVTYQGKPAAGAAVHFHREGATPEEAMTFPIGIVDADGHFDLEVPGVGKGATPGKYKVLVLWRAERDPNSPAVNAQPGRSATDGRKDPKSDVDRLKYRYFNLEKPLLDAEVKPGANALEPFELKD